MQKLNLLCLHGYRGNAQGLRRQLAPLADRVDDLARFVCLDAPSLAAGGFGWWHATAIESTDAQIEAGVGRGTKRYEGWQRTVDAIVSAFVQQGPFDGVFGFSQGAALASMLVGLRSPGDSIGEASSQPDSLAFDFAVMVGGFVSADPDLATLYGRRSNYDLSSMHVIGRSDRVVPREASHGLASKFRNPAVLEHEGGHVIPDLAEIHQRFRAFLEDMCRRKATHQGSLSRA